MISLDVHLLCHGFIDMEAGRERERTETGVICHEGLSLFSQGLHCIFMRMTVLMFVLFCFCYLSIVSAGRFGVCSPNVIVSNPN